MENFGFVSVIALFSYTFLMLIFLAAKKNRLINRFLFLMLLMICWSGGSVLMRFEMWPSYILWYHVSVTALLFLPYAYLLFVNEMIEKKSSLVERIFLILLSAVCLLNITTNCFIKYPQVVNGKNGHRFIYTIEPSALCLFVLCGAMFFYIFSMIIVKSRENRIFAKRFEPIVLGIIILFLGQTLLCIPVFSGFPIDVLCGIINAGLLFYALVKRRLFQLKMLANKNVCYGAGLLFSLLLFYNLSPFPTEKVTINSKQYIMVAVFCFALISMLLTYVWQVVVENVFVKEEIQQADILRRYSSHVSQSLNLNEILLETADVIRRTIGIDRIYIRLLNDREKGYEVVYGSLSPHTLRTEHPVVQLLEAENGSLLLKDICHTTEYLSMSEAEKQHLKDMNIQCIAGFHTDKTLIGILLLSGKDNKRHFSYNDQMFLDSICSIASIAFKNAKLYEKAYTEARTDELTGLVNRKYFYEILEREYQENIQDSLALVIINVDDFKLFNQLYGTAEGDIALRNIAQIIKSITESNGIVARYSGKEFAIILPGYDVLQAKALAETIRQRIYKMNLNDSEYKMKMLTVSIGISAAPSGASSATELVNNADMAVYHVKHNGKNAIQVFDMQVQDSNEAADTMNVQVYHEYETTIYALTAAIDAKDHYTFSHSNSVAQYAIELASLYGCNGDMVEIVRQAGLLHDVGKIGIPEEILNKPGKLTDEEYEIMKGHVESSIGIIRHLPSLDYVIPAVIGHHERYDGKGYPRGIQGDKIPILARILCIVDSFDAMVSKRSYKTEMPVEKALAEIEQQAGQQFDPELASLFVSSVRSGKIKPILKVY